MAVMDRTGLYKPFRVYSGDRDIGAGGDEGFDRPALGGIATPACKNDGAHNALHPHYTYPPTKTRGPASATNPFVGDDGDVYIFSTMPSGNDDEGRREGAGTYSGSSPSDGWCGKGRIKARVWQGTRDAGQWGPASEILNVDHSAGFHAYEPLGYDMESRRRFNCPSGAADVGSGRGDPRCMLYPVTGCSVRSATGRVVNKPGECVRYHIYVNENKTLTVFVPKPEGDGQLGWNDPTTMTYEMMPKNYKGANSNSLILNFEAGSHIQWSGAMERNNFLAVLVADPQAKSVISMNTTQRVPPPTSWDTADKMVTDYMHILWFSLAGIFGLLTLNFGIMSARETFRGTVPGSKKE